MLLLDRHGLTTSKRHLKQALAAFNRGEWSSTNGELSNFYESYLSELADKLAIELQMAPIRTAVHIAGPDFGAAMSGSASLSEMRHLNESAAAMLDQFVWWAGALKAARRMELAARPIAGS